MNIRAIWLTLATAALAAAATEADFGLVGLAPFENARLTAVCDGSVAPSPCLVTFEFHDRSGRTLKETTLTLPAGAGGVLDFVAPPDPDRPGLAEPPESVRPAGIANLVQLEPCIKVLRGAAFLSLEVFDRFSQRTRILINWGDRSRARTGDVDFGLAGITPFDTARLGAFCQSDGSSMPPPCDVTFEFHDLEGKVLKQSRMTLQPDTGGFLDLKLSETRSTSGRVEIDPCFKVAGGQAVGTFAILDNFFGLTLVQAYPAVPAVGVR